MPRQEAIDGREREEEAQLLSDAHEMHKKTRGRGTETPNYLAAVRLLKNLESEYAQIRRHLDEAWSHLDSKNGRKCSRLTDEAQQRLHKAVKKLERKEKRARHADDSHPA